MYRLVVPKETQQRIRKMHPGLKKKLRASLAIIMSDPGSGKALMDELWGLRSFRVRSFRIIYRIAAAERIELVAIGPRKRIYEETMRSVRRKNCDSDSETIDIRPQTKEREWPERAKIKERNRETVKMDVGGTNLPKA